ncbi:unnamed protein product, partial [Prorocentrum cordatum]
DKGEQLSGVNDRGLRRFLLLMAKRLLKCAQGVRELGGCLFDAFLCPSDGREALEMSEQIRNGAEALQRDGRARARASAGLVEAPRVKGLAVGASDAMVVEGLWEWLGSLCAEEKIEPICLCRLDKTHDKEQGRVAFLVRRGRRRLAVIQSCAQVDVARKRGEAPASLMGLESQGYLCQLLE